MKRPGPERAGLDPAWSRRLVVPSSDGSAYAWHLLDSGPVGPGVDSVTGTLLCVHGNPTWSYLWRRLVAAPPPGWRVVAPDQLGMGWSQRLDRPRTYAERVRDLGDLTDALGLTGPVITVGHDWGGAISLGWAVDHRDQLAGVVLTNTAVAQPPGDRGPALIRLADLPVVRGLACVRTPLFVAATSRLSSPPLPQTTRRALAAPYRTAARRRAVGDFVADIPFVGHDHPSAAAVAAVAEGTQTLDAPALLLWGPRDPVFGERYLADLRSRLPQASVHRFEGAGHLVTEDAPAYAEVIARWVGDLASPPAAVPSAPTIAPGTSARRLWTALDERAHDDSPAVVEVGGGSVSWAELSRRVRALAGGLVATGLRPGDRVGLLVEPSIDLTVAVYAVWRAGGVVVVADKGLGFTGMRRALRGAAVTTVIGSGAGLIAARAMGLPGRRLAAGSRLGSPLGPTLGLRRALGATDDLAALERRGGPLPPEPPAEAECAVLFTSGATGPAKGVVYRHRQAAAQLELVRSTYALGEDDRMVAAFAPFALLGPALGVASVVPDIDVTAPGTLTAAALGDAADAVGATVVFASPAALRNVVATASSVAPRQRAALGRVRLLMSAGAPVPVTLLSEMARVLPAAGLHTPYGMTEALPVTDVSLEQILAAGPGEGVCVGRPLTGVEVGLAGPHGPVTSESGVTGEICVAGPHVKDRYDALWATQRASSRSPGWHRTGDVGHLDDAGRLWVEGRLAHVIHAAGGVLTPVPIEQRVEALPVVAAAAAVGVGPAGTQAVVLVVVPTGRAPRSMSPATLELADAVRTAAGLPVAAVLVAPALPVDIRHQSKVDRLEVARRAERLLR